METEKPCSLGFAETYSCKPVASKYYITPFHAQTRLAGWCSHSYSLVAPKNTKYPNSQSNFITLEIAPREDFKFLAKSALDEAMLHMGECSGVHTHTHTRLTPSPSYPIRWPGVIVDTNSPSVSQNLKTFSLQWCFFADRLSPFSLTPAPSPTSSSQV